MIFFFLKLLSVPALVGCLIGFIKIRGCVEENKLKNQIKKERRVRKHSNERLQKSLRNNSDIIDLRRKLKKAKGEERDKLIKKILDKERGL